MPAHLNVTPALADAPDSATARMIAAQDGIIVYANAAFEEMCGDAHLKGRSIHDILQFKNAATADQTGLHLVSFTRGKSTAALQFDWVTSADGTPFLIASGQAQDSISPDIVERLVSSGQDDLAHFFNLSPDMMAMCDDGGYIIRANQTASDMLGPAKNIFDILHPEDRAGALPAIQNILKADTPGMMADFEARAVSPQKHIRFFHWRMTESGGHIYVTARDVTDSRQQMDNLARHEKFLSEAEAIGHMGRWRWVTGNEYIEWSDEIYRIFGLNPAQFTPTLENVNTYMHKRDVGRMMQAFQRAMIARTDYDIDFRVIRPNGEKRYVLCQGRCEMDSDGDVVALYGIMQDVTAVRLHEKDLKAAVEAAQRAYAARTQFLANMSHELRTPLNAVIGFSEMMERQLLGPLGNDKYVEYIRGIRESGEHLLDLITDILDMSKIEAGKYELAYEQINIAKTVKLALHMMEGRAMDSSIRLNGKFAHEDRTIIADRRAVTQILLNLLSNAVKFSKSGGQVNVECTERDDQLFIKVQDFGIGIPAHKIAVVTKPFEQAASHYTREHEGTGLGLAITKELVEMHGGAMHIESTVHVGTTVTVRLPFDSAKVVRDKKVA